MPHNLTDSSTFTAAVQVPDSGDARAAASVNGAFQALANRTAYLNDQKNLTNAVLTATRAGLNGLLIGARNVSWLSNTQLIVEGFYAHHINNAPYAAQAAATVAPGSDANDTWHYLYAKDDGGGGIDFVRSTTGPDASQTIKSDDATRIYICSYYVDGSGNIRPFQKRGNKYLWRRSKISNYTISSATPGTFTDQSLAVWVSPYSSMAILESIYSDSTGTAEFRTNGDTTNATKVAAPGTQQEFAIETDGSRVIEYRINGGTLPIFFLNAVGYYE